MRILQVHKDFAPLEGGGGTARHIFGLSRALASKGHEVRIASLDPHQVDCDCEVVYASPLDLHGQIRWADVVHVHGARSKYAVTAAIQAKTAGKPFFYTPHAFYGARSSANAAIKMIWDRTAEKFMVEQSAQTILLTEVWRDFLATRGISSERTSIVPNCILEADLFSVQKAAANTQHLPGSPAILTVGRLDPVKRVQDIIQALTRDDLQHAHLHVVGRGSARQELEQLAVDSKVEERVTFYGFCDDATVMRMAAGSDTFVLASEMEGLPTVLLEMLLGGTPIICTRIPGNLAITSVAGIDATYEVGDVEGLARLLRVSPEMSVSAATVDELRRQFTWEKRVDDVIALYSGTLSHLH